MNDEKTIKDVVRNRYGALAAEGSACCRPREDRRETDRSCGRGYSPEDIASLDPAVVSMGLGCGNPVALTELRTGEVVLDLGSGGGIDVFLAARRVGPTGKAIGVDMAEEMLDRARRAASAMGIANVEFRQGDIEALPLSPESVDVVISNCVINLAPNKGQVFWEAFRVLRPGGRMVVSDIVSTDPLPSAIRTDPEAWARCIGGALEEREYLGLIQAAGFQEVEVLSRRGQAAPGELFSISVRARKAPSPLLGKSQQRGEGAFLLTPRDRALIAVGVARTVGTATALRSCIEEAKTLGWSEEAIQTALDIADRTREMASPPS
ncbi:MAG: arsenite methyltransferase [Candidatus Rokubacteria bacterium]|nr:arsenite methyltransferase [Candidatus Rokubacteria bacterium]